MYIKFWLKYVCDCFQNNVNFLKVDLRDKFFYKEIFIIVGCNMYINLMEKLRYFMIFKKENYVSFLFGDFDMF